MKRIFVMFRTPLVVGIVLVGVLATLVAAAAMRRSSEERASLWLTERAEIVSEAVESTVLAFSDGLQSVRAFMEVTPDVDQALFTDYVSRLDERLSLIGLAHLDIVPNDQLDEYESAKRVRDPDFEVRAVNVTGEQLTTLGERDVYYPVELFAPGVLLIPAISAEENPLALSNGVDGGSVPEWRASLESDFASSLDPQVSDFLNLSRLTGVDIGQAFVIAAPVFGNGPEAEPTGILAAPMIDKLLPTELDISITDDVVWELTSAGIGFSGEPAGISQDRDVDLPGTTWLLRVQATAEGRAALAGTSTWVTIVVGLGATMILAALAELFLQRSRSKARVAELQRLSEDKDRFLASVSHEIRTPLTAVSGLARELRDRPSEFEEEELHQLLVMVAEQSDEVAAIVEDLLVAARSDIGKVNVRHAAVDVGEQVRAALDGSSIGADVIGRPTTLAYADAQRIRQILRNLLTNAGRYGGEKVQVRFQTTSLTVSIEVADSGDPIPAEQVRRIFDPYTTAENDNGVVGSIGLGLFISRTLAELMGGRLAYDHDGNWSVFTLSLPSIEAAAAAPAKAD